MPSRPAGVNKQVRLSDPAVRSEAVLALLEMGPPARDAAPVRREAEKGRGPRVRANATKARTRVEGAP
jgi:hypothetical protein